MNFIKKIKNLFRKEAKINYDRVFRDLLRENLKTVAVDVFYHEDPIISMSPPDRKVYLAYFHGLVTDKKLLDRLQYFINKQANLTLKNGSTGELDKAGVMKMDGTSIIIDDIKRLSAMFVQEEKAGPPMRPGDELRL